MSRYRKDGNLLADLMSVSCGQKSRLFLHNEAKDNLSFTQRLQIDKHLKVHNGCVNTIWWNDSGRLILSGSDDQHLVVTDPFTGRVLLSFRSAHRANIFCAKFIPNCSDHQIVSCSGDGMIFHTDIIAPKETTSNGFDCHDGAVYEILTVPNDSNSFLSCGEDGTVRWFDIRTKSHCNKEHCKEDVMISCRRAIMSLAVHPLIPYQLVAGCSDNYVRIYDRRMLGTLANGGSPSHGAQGLVTQFTAPSLADRCHRITSVAYSHDGSEILVSYSSDHIYLFNTKNEEVKSLAKGNILKNNEPRHCSRSKDEATGGVTTSEGCVGQSRAPPIKRLRLRGDWSDTGPNARPERERTEPVDPTAVNVMQRMSDMLTRWLEGAMRRANVEPERNEETAEQPVDVVLNASADSQNDTDSSTSHNSSQNIAAECSSHSDEGELLVNVDHGNSAAESTPAADLLSSSPSFIHSDSETSPGNAESTVLPDIKVPTNVTCMNFSQQVVENMEVLPGAESVPETLTADHVSVNIHVSDVSRQSAGSSADACEMSSVDSGTGGLVCQASADISGNRSEKLVTSNDFTTVEQLVLHVSEDTGNLETLKAATSVVEATSSRNQEAISEDDTDELSQSAAAGSEHSASQNSRDYAVHDDRDPDIERHLAAIQLQEIFRKRQASRAAEHTSHLPRPILRQVYRGHRNSRTMIKKATFWGTKYVMSGSDCGHIFIWDRESAKLVMLLEGDKHVVNCLQPHPYYPVLASSGIDYDIKLWMPTNEEPMFDESLADELMKRNELMLDETRDTVTVPASFMLRMLASLSHARRAQQVAGE